jgi:hypothetical protein
MNFTGTFSSNMRHKLSTWCWVTQAHIVVGEEVTVLFLNAVSTFPDFWRTSCVNFTTRDGGHKGSSTRASSCCNVTDPWRPTLWISENILFSCFFIKVNYHFTLKRTQIVHIALVFMLESRFISRLLMKVYLKIRHFVLTSLWNSSCKLVQKVKLLPCILDVPDSNLGEDTNYSVWGLKWVCSKKSPR